MNTALLIVGVVVLLVVIAAVAEALFRSGTHRPLAASKPSLKDVNRKKYRQLENDGTELRPSERHMKALQKAEEEADRLRLQQQKATLETRRQQEN